MTVAEVDACGFEKLPNRFATFGAVIIQGPCWTTLRETSTRRPAIFYAIELPAVQVQDLLNFFDSVG